MEVEEKEDNFDEYFVPGWYWVLHARVESQNGAGNLTHELNLEDNAVCNNEYGEECGDCLLYTSPSPRDS